MGCRRSISEATSAATFNRLTSPITIVERDRGAAAVIELPGSDAMKMSTVDLVVTGDERAAVAAAVDAVRRGQRVLVVLRSDGARVVPRLRRLCRAAKSLLTVMTNAEVVCVDGVDRVEAVVIRYARTGRLCAMNTPAFLSCDGSTHPPRAGNGNRPRSVPERRHRSQAADGGDADGLKRLIPVATCAWDPPSLRAQRESTPLTGTPPRSRRDSRDRPPDR